MYGHAHFQPIIAIINIGIMNNVIAIPSYIRIFKVYRVSRDLLFPYVCVYISNISLTTLVVL